MTFLQGSFKIKYFITKHLHIFYIIIIIAFYNNFVYLLLFIFIHCYITSVIFFFEKLNSKFVHFIIKNNCYLFLDSGEKKIFFYIKYLIIGFSKYNFIDFNKDDDLYLKKISNNYLKLNNIIDLESNKDFFKI